MRPEFCENCKYLRPDGGCGRPKGCAKWQVWFAREWRRIRKAAEKIKENRGGVPK